MSRGYQRDSNGEWVIFDDNFPAEIECFVSKNSRTIAAQVVYFRQFRKMTQEQLAAAAGMDQPAIARLEKTLDIHWTMPTLARIAEALDMKVSADFIVGDGQRSEQQKMTTPDHNRSGASRLQGATTSAKATK
jgi:DNA-binding Xre family transcriptional regulator